MSNDAPQPGPSRTSRRIKSGLAGCACVLLAVLVYHAGWGRVMPFLPWAPGFDRVERSRAVVLYHADTRDAALGQASTIDDLVVKVETFHALTFRTRPEVFVTGSEAEYRRLSGGSARFRAMPVRGRVFLSPRAVSQSERDVLGLQEELEVCRRETGQAPTPDRTSPN